MPVPAGAVVLLEDLSNLTANEWFGPEGREGAEERILAGVRKLKEESACTVVVTNELFSDGVTYDKETADYLSALARLNVAVAAEADRVYEVVCGIPCTVKPETGRESEEEKEGDGGMRIITGGAFQGKRAFAEKLYPGVEWTDGGRCDLDEIRTCRAVYGFHEFVKRWLEQGKSWEELASLMLEENRDLILICDEIGCGLVPVDAFEREYRESTGRVMNALAEQAERVDRVVCGIGRRIK